MFPHGDFLLSIAVQGTPYLFLFCILKLLTAAPLIQYLLYLIMDLTRINLIHYAIPGFIVLMLIELIFSAIQKRELYETRDTISSLAMGIGNVLTGLVSKSLRSEEHTSELQSQSNLVCRL